MIESYSSFYEVELENDPVLKGNCMVLVISIEDIFLFFQVLACWEKNWLAWRGGICPRKIRRGQWGLQDGAPTASKFECSVTVPKQNLRLSLVSAKRVTQFIILKSPRKNPRTLTQHKDISAYYFHSSTKYQKGAVCVTGNNTNKHSSGLESRKACSASKMPSMIWALGMLGWTNFQYGVGWDPFLIHCFDKKPHGSVMCIPTSIVRKGFGYMVDQSVYYSCCQNLTVPARISTPSLRWKWYTRPNAWQLDINHQVRRRDVGFWGYAFRPKSERMSLRNEVDIRLHFFVLANDQNISWNWHDRVLHNSNSYQVKNKVISPYTWPYIQSYTCVTGVVTPPNRSYNPKSNWSPLSITKEGWLLSFQEPRPCKVLGSGQWMYCISNSNSWA